MEPFFAIDTALGYQPGAYKCEDSMHNRNFSEKDGAVREMA